MIQTRGFQTDVQPVYSAVNPALIAFNPTSITNGALSGFQLVDTYNKLKAFQRQQDEINQLAPDRVAALQSGYGADVARNTQTQILAPQETNVKSLALTNQAGVLPLQGIFDQQAARNAIALQPGDFTLAKGNQDTSLAAQPFLSDIAVSKAQSDYSNLENNLTASRLNAQNAADEAQFTSDTIGKQHDIILNELNDKLASAKTDKDRKDALEQAKVDLLKAQAEQEKAKATFELGGGRQTAALRDQTSKEIGDVQRALSDLNNPQKNGGVNLSEYELNTYGPSGYGSGKLNTGILGGLPDRNPTAEGLLRRRAQYNQKLDSLLQTQSSLPSLQSGITPITVPGFGPVATTNALPTIAPVSTPAVAPTAAAVAYLRANPNAASAFDAKYGKGMAAKYIVIQ